MTGGVCWKRSLDATKIRNYLIKNGYKVVNNIRDADVVVLITCAFLNQKAEESHRLVKKYLKRGVELVVAGCLPAVEKDKLREYFDGPTIETKNLSEDIERIFPPTRIRFDELHDSNILFEDLVEGHSLLDSLKKKIEWLEVVEKKILSIKDCILKSIFGENSPIYKFSKKQYHVRVAWGCTGNCSYCTIKKSTGSFRSKPIDVCINEFRMGLEKGYKNFILDATDVGAYGIDINSSFPELLKKLTSFNGDYYISIRELNAKWVVRYVEELIEILKKNKILLFDIAIQSASPRILKLMKRPTDIEKLREALMKIREVKADFFLTCEFIVGFPTETEEEFMQSLDFIRDIGFDGGQIYEFSCRPGTEAENIEPKIPRKEILRRIRIAKKYLKSCGYKSVHLPNQGILVFRKKI